MKVSIIGIGESQGQMIPIEQTEDGGALIRLGNTKAYVQLSAQEIIELAASITPFDPEERHAFNTALQARQNILTLVRA